jgi:hypothetical protein
MPDWCIGMTEAKTFYRDFGVPIVEYQSRKYVWVETVDLMLAVGNQDGCVTIFQVSLGHISIEVLIS